MRSIIIFSIFVSFLFAFSSCKVNDYASSSKPVSHGIWNDLLQQHVDPTGKVNYQGFIQDSVQFNAYLDILQKNHPNAKHWTKDEQLAYWLNAYNAFTVKIVADNYPVPSIKDIKNGIPFVNTVWDIKFIKIEKAVYDLNNIEHGIVRPKFKEPRAHFALNCASVSCPRLRNEAYTPEQLEEQLSDQARYFLTNTVKNKIADPQQVELSKIFSWFKGDFTDSGLSLIEFLNQYAPIQISKEAKINHLDYDWNLNE